MASLSSNPQVVPIAYSKKGGLFWRGLDMMWYGPDKLIPLAAYQWCYMCEQQVTDSRACMSVSGVSMMFANGKSHVPCCSIECMDMFMFFCILRFAELVK